MKVIQEIILAIAIIVIILIAVAAIFILFSDEANNIGSYCCMGVTYPIQDPFDKNVFRFLYQHGEYGSKPISAHWTFYSEFNITTNSWSVIDGSVFFQDKHGGTGNIHGSYFHTWYPVGAWYNSSYHIVFLDDGQSPKDELVECVNTSFSNFQSVDTSNKKNCSSLVSLYGIDLSTFSFYAWNDSYAWLLMNSAVNHDLWYWEWTESGGWNTTPNYILLRDSDYCPWADFLIWNETIYYAYFVDSADDKIKYVKSTNSGSSWGNMVTVTDLPVDYGQRLYITRYGKTCFLTVIDNNDDTALYKSTNGENWSFVTVLLDESSYQCPSSQLVNQSHLVWVTCDENKYNTKYGNGLGCVYGGVYEIGMLNTYPNTPEMPYPNNNANISAGSTSTQINITVNGSNNEIFDVYFYWSDGTFIDVDKHVPENGIASIHVKDLTLDTTYSWYTIARGCTRSYWGDSAITTDENRSDTFSFSTQSI